MRGLWLIVCVGGLLAGMLIATLLGYEVYAVRNDPQLLADRAADNLWPIVFVVGFAAACLVGLLQRPAEIEKLTSEEPAQRAAWLDELNTDDDLRA